MDGQEDSAQRSDSGTSLDRGSVCIHDSQNKNHVLVL